MASALAIAGAVSLSACDSGQATSPNAVPRGEDEATSYQANGKTYPLVTIQPNDNTMSVGQHYSMHAMVSSPVSSWNGREVTFTSSNPSVVTVTTTNWGAANGDSARLVANTAGTAVITATTESGTTGTMNLTVGSSTAPSAPNALSACGQPNVMSWDFSSDSWGPLNYTSFLGDGHVISDPTSPSGYSAMWTWTSSSSDEGGQVNAMFSNSQSAYVRFAYKQSANFPDNGIKKILRFRASGFNQLLGTLDIYDNKYIWFYDQLDSRANFYQSAGPSPSENRGSWHWIEAYNNISESNNLQFKVWVDGTLVLSGTDAVSNQGLSFGMASPGGTFNAPAGDGTDYITDIAVSTNCMGAPW